jgi:hypothetical protein
MNRKPKKALPARAKGRSALSGLAAADLERRRFDARLADSALRYMSAAGEQAAVNELPELCEEKFGWLRDRLPDLADLARVPRKEADLAKPTAEQAADAERMFQNFFRLWFGVTHKPGGEIELRPQRPGDPIKYDEGREFLDKQLGQLWIVEHYRFTPNGLTRIAIPYLNSVTRCIAYVVAILMENRWGLADRVKVCPYRRDPKEGFHVFLNFRLRADGNLMDGAGMKYCCPQHQNADGQRQHRLRARKDK